MRLFFLGTILWLLSMPAYAVDLEYNGYLLSSNSNRINANTLTTGEKYNWLVAQQQLHLEIMAATDTTNLIAKIELINDSIDGTQRIDIRELYGEYLGESVEFRLGRQILTWGVADRLFINDVFSKDWTAFFAGQPLEYMKTASDMAKISYFSNDWDIELVLQPTMQYDQTPASNRYVVFGSNMPVQKPANRLGNGEVATRLHTAIGTTDVALYGFKGFWHQPDKGMQAGNIIFPRLNNVGLTIQDSIWGGVLSFETGYYQSADDKDGKDPFIANSQYRYLVSYERDVMTDVTVALQAYGELMHNHQDYLKAAQAAFNAGFGPKPQSKHRKIGTLNIRALWMNQTLTTSLFAMAVATGGRMVNPDVNYTINDNFSINAGGHIFWGGSDSWMLGMMKNNDNLYVNSKWSF
ncbi:MAG: hypothetical protein Q9M28_00860 [Mariprofundaceae bacterium]|nr:hypothetical protein [Mariprofundaceae bacterium]